MYSTVAEHDNQRYRWKNFRESLALSDPEDDEFGSKGLASQVKDRSVRILILPSDPLANNLPFDEEVSKWWSSNFVDPATKRNSSWLFDVVQTSDAIVKRSYRNEQEPWDAYLALKRSGVLETELGTNGIYTYNQKYRCFRMLDIVGKLWFVISFYSQIIEKFQIDGAYELSLSLIDTKKALLGQVAAGWANPGPGYSINYVPFEKNILFRMEIDEWPTNDDIKSLAFQFGDWIDNAWGSNQKRYLTYYQGQSRDFDVNSYSP
jgi:hypothetical protein